MTAAFVRAMTTRDHDAIVALLADDVVLHSPVSHRPYQGRSVVGPLLCAAADIVDGLTYGEELVGPEHTALMFTGSIGGRDASGVDLLAVGADGLITEFTAVLRPLSAARAFSEAMGPRAAAIFDRSA